MFAGAPLAHMRRRTPARELKRADDDASANIVSYVYMRVYGQIVVYIMYAAHTQRRDHIYICVARRGRASPACLLVCVCLSVSMFVDWSANVERRAVLPVV